jgi:methionyl-tRNA formyltransferase
MRILFAGTPPIAVPALETVASRHEVCAVLTGVDRPAGRGKKPLPSAVKTRAMELGLPVMETERIDAAVMERVKALSPRLLVVVAFGRIFREEFIGLFPLGGVNLHPSLLPRHRGPSPVSAAILAGDAETGVCIQKLALKFDTGDVLAMEKIALRGDETAGSLSDSLAARGAALLGGVLDRLEQGPVEGVAQDEGRATYCRLIKKKDGRIDWNESASAIERKVRAYDPWPKASTMWGQRTVLVLQSRLYAGTLGAVPDSGEGVPPGTVIASAPREGLLVRTGAGILAVQRLQLEFKKAVDWKAFQNGHPQIVGSRFGG